MIYQLWFAVIGSNGDGIASITKRNSREIEELKESLQEFIAGREATCPVVSRRKKNFEHHAVVVGMVCGFLGSVIGGLLPVVLGG
jgi:hypothetical protein